MEPELGGNRREALTGMEPSLGGAARDEHRLLFLLRKSNTFVYYSLMRMMGRRGSETAITSLRAALANGGEVERAYAATALGWIGQSVFVPDLIGGLTDQSRYVREVCVWALIKIGYVPDLRQALAHLSAHVRAQVALVLGEIGSLEAVDALMQAGEDEDRGVRRACHRGLFLIAEKHGDAASEATPALIARLRAEDAPRVRGEIAGTLGAIGDRQAVPALIEALSDSDAEVRAIAAEGLGHMSDVRAIDGLITLLADNTPFTDTQRVCDTAADALSRIGTAAALDAVRLWRGPSI